MSDLPPAKGGSFPVPNSLIDSLLPSLRDTELRVLLVVLRQTEGWRDPKTGRPKARDWLTHGRLKRDTGRASEAVSAALDALVRRGLIITEDSTGRALVTPAERRRLAAALYFRPGPLLTFPAAMEGTRGTRKTEIRNAKTTKDNGDNQRLPFRKPVIQEGQNAESVEKGTPLTAEQMASIEAIKKRIRARLTIIS